MSITFPSDPVAQGATVIQSSTFNNVSADYSEVPYESVLNFISRNKISLRYFPMKKPNDTVFLQRNDLTGDSAALRSITAVRTTAYTANRTYMTAAGAREVAAILVNEVHVSIWHPSIVTLPDTSSLTVWQYFSASGSIVTNPATGLLEADTDTARLIDESTGFLLLRVAANVPTLAPMLNALAGVKPI